MTLAYCINRDDRPDRWFQFHTAYYQCDWLAKIPLVRKKANLAHEMFVPPSWKHPVGYYCVDRDRKLILEEAYLARYDEILLLEDDALIPAGNAVGDAVARARAVLPADWLGLYLGGVHIRAGQPVTQGLCRCKGVTQLHAILLNRAGIIRVLDHFWCEPHRIGDWGMHDLHSIDERFYAIDPFVISTIGGWSDNAQAQMVQGQ